MISRERCGCFAWVLFPVNNDVTQHKHPLLAMSEIDSCKKIIGTTPEGERALGVYLHVPFCATRCDFCAFYEEAPTAEAVRNMTARNVL